MGKQASFVTYDKLQNKSYGTKVTEQNSLSFVTKDACQLISPIHHIDNR
jgi:hypothetical protein